MSFEKIVLATGNQGKVAELADKLASLNIEVVAQSEFDVPEVAETGTTFIENAIIKARHAAKITGLPAIADDSGLEVEALGGAPGIYSARFAGVNANDSDNIDKLLSELGDNP
ncbi:MAG: non-canonical purine NTP pyrophosphatase, partial [Pseudoalteromonas spongiae]